MNDLYLFGYGSIIDRPGMKFKDSFLGYTTCFIRRFWQYSIFHRGTEENPGRTVTLIRKTDLTKNVISALPEEDFEKIQEEKVWGRVFQIDRKIAKETLEILDVREAGYNRMQTEIVTKDGKVLSNVYCYYGKIEKIHPESVESIQHVIAFSKGPSGYNADYLFTLARVLSKFGIEDPYITGLEKKVRRILEKHPNLEIFERIKTVGKIYINQGAVQSVSNKGKPLFTAGIEEIEGSFESDSWVMILEKETKKLIGKGKTKYCHLELNNVKGLKKDELSKKLNKTCAVIGKETMLLY